MRKQFDYVASACNMMGINTKHYYENKEKAKTFIDGFKACVARCNNELLKRGLDNHSISILFNAFTEKETVGLYGRADNFGAKYLYGDSGGLQIVTAGRQITSELKTEVYNTQTACDFGMCFDIIPLETLSLVRSKTERSNPKNKLFIASKHKESGRLTGKNVREQCEVFAKKNAKTKAIIIVQGNNYDDMLLYFDEIFKEIPKELYPQIGGIATADTCMGTGQLETIEMLRAAHIISENYPEEFSKQLHLLGVGAHTRIEPLAFLQEKYLKKFQTLSYDSSSHTSAVLWGKFTEKRKTIKHGLTRSHGWDSTFSTVFDFFDGMHRVSKEEFLLLPYPAGEENGKFSKTGIVNRAKNPDIDLFYSYSLLCPMFVLYQIYDFIIEFDLMMKDTTPSDKPIAQLRNVENEVEMQYWFDNLAKYCQSERINSTERTSTLIDFF